LRLDGQLTATSFEAYRTTDTLVCSPAAVRREAADRALDPGDLVVAQLTTSGSGARHVAITMPAATADKRRPQQLG
jgi:cell wall-associated NlpC family hydrolase